MSYGDERYAAPNSGKAIAAHLRHRRAHVVRTGRGRGPRSSRVVMGWISVALMALGVVVLAIVLVVVGTTS